MYFHLTHPPVFSVQGRYPPDRLPTFTPALVEIAMALILLGLLVGWTPLWSIALAIFALSILQPLLATPLAFGVGCAMLLMEVGTCGRESPIAYCIALGSIVGLGAICGRFLRHLEWRLASQSVLLQLTASETATTPEQILHQSLSLLREFACADAAIALRQLDEVTAEALVCLPTDALPNTLTTPQIFAEALQTNQCLYYTNYPSDPRAVRALVTAGTQSLAVLPLQPPVDPLNSGRTGEARGAILLIWYRKTDFSHNLQTFIESFLGQLRTLLRFQDTTLRMETATTRLGAILETIEHGIIFVEESGEHSWVNSAAAQHLDLTPGEVEPMAIAQAMAKLRLSAENQQTLCEQAAEFFTQPAAEIRNWHWIFEQPQRKVLSISSTATRVRNVPGRLWVLDDITDEYLLQQALRDRSRELSEANEELQEKGIEQSLLYQELAIANEELEKLATKDGLTQIANRRTFDKFLDREWPQLRRVNSPISLILIDVDFFKRYNDTYGHQAGDECLKQIARALSGAVKRETDLVARYGGEEFAVILPHTDIKGAVQIAHQIRLAVAAQQIEHSHSQVSEHVTLSMGIATQIPSKNSSADELITAADEALYHAKTQGRDRFVVFQMQMHAQAAAVMQLEHDLKQAIERHEFRLHYQPIVSLSNGEIIGFEALVRWQHPTKGLVSPAEFIPIAESTGLIQSLSWWVFKTACTQLREWQLRFPHHPGLMMSVNICGQQIEQVGVGEKLEKIVKEIGILASSIKLEITETCLLERKFLPGMLQKLKQQGFQIAIDDFGTGYSSLNRLHKFPIDTLKIDRSFIQQIGTDEKSLAIVKAIIVLAHTLKMKVIAEGIETLSQLEQLQALHCEYGQGYLFSKPLDSAGAFELLAQNLIPQTSDAADLQCRQLPSDLICYKSSGVGSHRRR